jgi:hypothetical protein
MLRKAIHLIALTALALQMGMLLCVSPLHAATEPQPNAPANGDLNSSEFMFNLGGINSNISNKSSWVSKGINYFAERIITIIAATAGSFAVLMMSIGGLLMITSAGDQGQFDKGKGYFKAAAIGLVAVLGAYLAVVAVQLLIKSIYG